MKTYNLPKQIKQAPVDSHKFCPLCDEQTPHNKRLGCLDCAAIEYLRDLRYEYSDPESV